MQALLKLPAQDPGLAAKIIKNKKIDLNIPESVNSTRFAEVWEEVIEPFVKSRSAADGTVGLLIQDKNFVS